MEQEKKLSLLRPFLPKEVSCTTFAKDVIIISGPDIRNCYCVSIDGALSIYHHTNLRQRPICWLESKPVYPGDLVWYRNGITERVYSMRVTRISPRDTTGAGIEGVVESPSKIMAVGELTWAPIDCHSWNKPKQKVRKWVNICLHDEGQHASATFHSTKTQADAAASSKRVACVEIEYEE